MKSAGTFGSSSCVARRWLAGGLALVMLWAEPAGAVIHQGLATTAAGMPVAGATFTATIDDGEYSSLQWDRVRRRCSHPSWGELFEQSHLTYQLQAEIPLAEALRFRGDFLSTYEGTTGSKLSRIETGIQWDQAWTSGLNASRYALRSDWTIKTGLNYSWGGTNFGVIPYAGTADDKGRFQINTDYFSQLGGFTPQPGYKIRAMAGLKCEGALNYLPSDGPSLQSTFQYYEPCDNICWYKYGQSFNIGDACSWIQLPPSVIPVQHVTGAAAGAGGDAMASQWAFKKLGLPLNLPWDRLAPVTVAVIDSGLDYRHPAFKPDNLWTNPEPGFDPLYPDDVMGWNYILGHNNPWDDIGHGTFVAGLILAVNPRARIMPIKVMDGFGGGLNSDIGAAVIYAVERGARVINLSVGTKGLSQLHQDVVDYARSRGVVIVTAAGNEGENVDAYTPGGVKGVLSVAALDQNDKKPNFGNWGQNVSLAAPGVDIVSWRARNSDFVLVVTGGKDYKPGANINPSDRWLYQASGTSFAAPFVTGAAALLFALNPNLTGRQVERMLVESADDVEVPGWDQITGAGRLNIARAALSNPNASLVAKVARIEPGQVGGQPAVQVFGTADGTTLKSYQVQLGRGEAPTSWKTVAVQADKSVEDGLLAAFPQREITARGKWSVRVIVQDASGRTREARGSLDIQ